MLQLYDIVGVTYKTVRVLRILSVSEVCHLFADISIRGSLCPLITVYVESIVYIHINFSKLKIMK